MLSVQRVRITKVPTLARINPKIYSRTAVQKMARRKRTRIETSVAYKEEKLLVMSVLDEAGRTFSTAEFTPRHCKKEECNKVSILADPFCIKCWSDKGYVVRKSGLNNDAGLGLFTEIARRKGTEICHYSGWFRRKESWDLMPKSKAVHCYTLESSDRMIIANTSAGGIGRYINDGQSKKKNNAALEQVVGDDGSAMGTKVRVVITKNVKEGEEILVAYGNEYKM